MSEKRRDNKGRILKTGESQRKDGRYLNKYIDTLGEAQSIYSWKLVSTDRIPAGKRDCISLREKEQESRKDLDDGIDTVYKSHEDKLPKITPHILRHTFCTRLAIKNINPKSPQYVMGHSNINITMNLYAHASIEGVKSEMISLIT